MLNDECRSIELEDTFFLHDQSNKQCVVKLSPAGLAVMPAANASSSDPIRTIPLDDIYGCLCMKSKNNARQYHLIVYLYGLKGTSGLGGLCAKASVLYRSRCVFTYGKSSDGERNVSEVLQWYRRITQMIYVRRKLVDCVRSKRAVVLVNPAGGAGTAYRLVMEHVIGVWSEAEFNYEIVVTG